MENFLSTPTNNLFFPILSFLSFDFISKKNLVRKSFPVIKISNRNTYKKNFENVTLKYKIWIHNFFFTGTITLSVPIHIYYLPENSSILRSYNSKKISEKFEVAKFNTRKGGFELCSFKNFT
jgi:hypothetical protein